MTRRRSRRGMGRSAGRSDQREMFMGAPAVIICSMDGRRGRLQRAEFSGHLPSSVPDARAPELLRAYLAERDVPCESCGYNLRNALGVRCPECGAVIPRPPADFIARRRAAPADLRLYCTECGYAVTGVNPDRCPECGG